MVVADPQRSGGGRKEGGAVVPRGLRKAGIAVVAAAAMVLAAACGPGGEGEAAPTGEELLARLVTDGDLDGDWRTDTAEAVDPRLEDMGADGLRLDAVRHLIEEGEDFDGGALTHEWLAD